MIRGRITVKYSLIIKCYNNASFFFPETETNLNISSLSSLEKRRMSRRKRDVDLLSLREWQLVFSSDAFQPGRRVYRFPFHFNSILSPLSASWSDNAIIILYFAYCSKSSVMRNDPACSASLEWRSRWWYDNAH